jgi:hypothetical protein
MDKTIRENCRVALVWEGFNQFNNLKIDLDRNGYEVEIIPHTQQGSDLIINGKYLAAIIEASDEFDVYNFCDLIRLGNISVPLFFITEDWPANCIKNAFAKGYPDHLYKINMPNLSDWIIQNIRKLDKSDPSGLKFYSEATVSSISFPINNSKMKDQYIDQIIKYVNTRNVRERVVHTIEDILDELITNALYNAPRDEHGAFLYQNYDRKENVVLSDTQSSLLTCLIDGSNFFISIKDPFGSLTKNKLMSYLSKDTLNAHIIVENKQGGAGIGLQRIFRLSHNFIINIAPGVFSETIICVSQESDILKQDNASLDIFVREH